MTGSNGTTGATGPLNDQRRFLGGQLVVLGAVLGLVVSGLAVLLVVPVRASGWAGLVPVFLASGCSVALSIVTGVVVQVWDRRTKRSLEDEGALVLRGAVRLGAPVPARVLRRRVSGRRTGVVVGPRGPVAEPGATITAFTVLPPRGPARRVAVLVPLGVPLAALAKGSTHLVRLHPTLGDLAFLDVTGDPAALAAAAADPRWAGRLPTGLSVAGGGRHLALAGLGGLALGTVVGVLLVLGVGALT